MYILCCLHVSCLFAHEDISHQFSVHRSDKYYILQNRLHPGARETSDTFCFPVSSSHQCPGKCCTSLLTCFPWCHANHPMSEISQHAWMKKTQKTPGLSLYTKKKNYKAKGLLCLALRQCRERRWAPCQHQTVGRAFANQLVQMAALKWDVLMRSR